MKGRNWKRWGLLCILLLLLGIRQDVPKAQAMDENRIYTITPEQNFIFDEQTGMITGYQETGSSVEGTVGQEPQPTIQPAATEVVIPASIRGVAVQGLSGTFFGNTVIQKLVIPDTLKTFGDDTFNGCSSLHSISVYKTDKTYTEDEVTERQNQEWGLHFVLSAMLSTGEGVVDTEEGVTENTKLYYEVLDQGGNCAVIPASLESIGERVFYSCVFASFDVMDGSASFCDSNEGGVNQPEGVGACLLSLDQTKLYRMAPRFRDNNNSLQYSMPEGIVEVLPYAGQGLGWQQVQVSTTVKMIDAYAFDGSGLLGVTFAEPSQLETIGDWAFAHNDNMDIILPASVKTIGKYSFAYIANRTPDLSKTQITVIPEHAFEGCPNLHTITMPATLLVIEPYAFAGNPNLNEVVFTGQTLNSIGTGAFQDCQNMHKIDIPQGITSIEVNTFEGCSNLNTVILPEGLKEIKDNAFSNCQNIHTMVIPSTVTHIADNSFSGSNTRDIDTSKNAYARQKISGEAALPRVGSTVTKGKLVYKYTKSNASGGTVAVAKLKSKSLKSISIPASISYGGHSYQVTAIHAKVFQNCKKLKNVTIGKNVKTIGKNAFKNCKQLKKITIKSTKLTKSSVKANAFKGIAKKAVVKVPKKKFKAYKKFLRKKGLGRKAKIKK